MSQPEEDASSLTCGLDLEHQLDELTIENRLNYMADCNNFPYCDDAEKYEKVASIGQETFG